MIIIFSSRLEQYPELVNFLHANTPEELLQQSKFLAPFYTELSHPPEIKLTPLEISALLNKSKQVNFLLSPQPLFIGNYPQLVARLLDGDKESIFRHTDQHLNIAKLFTEASQFIELNKISSEAALSLVKHNAACEIITALFKSSEQFTELAKGSSWASQWMLFNKQCAFKILQLFKTPADFCQLAPHGGTVECLLSVDIACEQIASLYQTVDEFFALAKSSEPLRSASARLALNKRSTILIANLFLQADEFIKLAQISSLTAQYLTIEKSSCVIIAGLFKDAEQFSRLVKTRCISPYYLTLHEESRAILAKLFKSREELLKLDALIKDCDFNCPSDHYSRYLGKVLVSEHKPNFFKPAITKNSDAVIVSPGLNN